MSLLLYVYINSYCDKRCAGVGAPSHRANKTPVNYPSNLAKVQM